MASLRWTGLLGWLLATLACAHAEAPAVSLGPGNTHIGLTVYALGLFPRSGEFTRFSGLLRFDPTRPADCRVQLTVQVASLELPSMATTRLALGATMLDAARYPTMNYLGSCDQAGTTGELTLHGVTRPVSLIDTRSGNLVTAKGKLRRQDYGVGGAPGLIGSTVKIAFSVDLPGTSVSPTVH